MWDLIRDANSYIEDRQPWALHKAGDTDGDRRGARRLPRGAAHRRAPRVAGDPARAPRELWRRLGLPGTPEEQRLPDAAAWGSAAPAGNRLEKGAALFPRLDRDRPPGRPGSTPTATCPPTRPRPPRSWTGPGRPGSSGWCASGPTWPPRRAAVGPGRAPTPRSTRPSASTPTTPEAGRRVGRAGRAGRGPGGRRRSARPASTSTTSTPRCDAQEEAFRAQIRLAHTTDRALVIHSRDAWDDTFRVLEDEGVPPRTVFHCFTGGPDEAAARAGPRHATSRSAASCRSRPPSDLRAAAALTPRRPHAGRDRLAVPRAGPAPREAERAGAASRSSARRWPRPATKRSSWWPRRPAPRRPGSSPSEPGRGPDLTPA